MSARGDRELLDAFAADLEPVRRAPSFGHQAAGVFGDVDDTGPAAELNCPYGLASDGAGVRELRADATATACAAVAWSRAMASSSAAPGSTWCGRHAR